MNINQLEYFVTTAHLGSFSATAKKLFVTPQAVSKAVGDLERELDVQLLEKSARGVKITPFGKVFSMKAKEVLADFDDLETLARHHAQANSKGGTLVVGMATSAYRGNAFTANDLTLFESTYPHIDLTLRRNPSGACLSALEDRIVDASIILGRVSKPSLACVKLLSMPLCVLASNSHPLASQDVVHVQDLGPYPVANPEDLRYSYTALTQHLETHDVHLEFESISPYLDQHQDLLNRNGLLFVLDDETLMRLYPDSRILPLAAEDTLRIPICLAYHLDDENANVIEFEHYLTETADRIMKSRHEQAQ